MIGMMLNRTQQKIADAIWDDMVKSFNEKVSASKANIEHMNMNVIYSGEIIFPNPKED